ncbi:nudC domain-containing protein 3-like [Lingula anatina]|uniref:NudC domain-containing protein 3 n=1 Tax=Lingula anatina TaxID=7574 RepID=A0A1S3J480_LINAN|nr:nudC domain-containing protein 3 [Lingula anatina]XP_013405071.1 nudC domain-containing protein 3-like [Lingula anatina]|eukprot:XP_013393896.1 nudC domain-containing protein 3 [Lingula anatina]
MALQEQYDTALLGILQNEGSLANFIDVIMGFLYRRTDFYRIMKSKEDKLGFPEGIAVQHVLRAYQKYADKAKKDEEKRQKLIEAKQRLKEQKMGAITEEAEEQNGDEVSSPKPQDTPNEPCLPQVAEEVTVDTGQGDHGQEEMAEAAGDVNMEEQDEDLEQTRMQKIFQSNPESYNGAIRDRYSWTQSITDLDVRVKVPNFILKGRDVKVDIQKKHLHVAFRDPDGMMVDVINEDLTWDINKQESIWTLVPGQHVHINLEKVQERWWEAVLVGEPKISTRKIDPSRPITDLDEEAQSKVGEMMYNEQRKRMGLPTSEEQKVNDMLKKAWDAEGSPFKGQPFDPSKINVSGNTMTFNN